MHFLIDWFLSVLRSELIVKFPLNEVGELEWKQANGEMESYPEESREEMLKRWILRKENPE